MYSKKYWKMASKFYDKFMKSEKKNYKLLGDLIKKDKERNLNVLELGAATGVVTENVQPYFKDYIVSDYSEDMIKKIEKKSIEDVKVELIDAYNIPYEDELFDIVIIAGTLHIVDRPENILEEIRRVLKDDGILIAPTFTMRGSKKEKFRKKIMEITGLKVINSWKPESYMHFIEENRFIVMKYDIIEAKFPITYIEAKKHD